jgi:hypothetical protein
MGLYLYAVCKADTAVVPDEGAPSDALRLIVSDGLAALVGEEREAPPTPSVDDLWEHERVVERLMQCCDVLPARYGSELDDGAAVARLLRGRRDELAAGLRRVRGAVELAVRAELTCTPEIEDGADPADDRRGTAYMAAALARERQVRSLEQMLHGRLAPLARAGSMRAATKPVPGCAGAYLVEREQTGAFRGRVAELDFEHGDVEITCTGPWPPYSFSGAPEAPA